jgi:hypothetical protein
MLRDVLFICAVITVTTVTLYGQPGGAPVLYQKWKYNLDKTKYKNREYPNLHERLPSPLITDLDGDGVNEIIIATKEPKLLVLHPPSANDQSGQPTLLREVSLLSSTRSIGSRHPVALRAGFLDPYTDSTDTTTTTVRQQSIVVVLKSWTVLCFDHSLRLQWETSASRIQSVLSIGPLVHQEVAVMISSLSIVPGDRGVVVVGGSMMLRDGVDDGSFEISGDRVQEDTDGSDSYDYKSEVILQHERDVYYAKVKRAEHFNYFAFDGRTGQVRWKHEAGAGMEQEDLVEDEIEISSTNNGYRMTKEDLRHMNQDGSNDPHDKSIMDWKEFRSSVLNELPHSWSERDDTELHVGHFNRDRHHRSQTKWTSHLKPNGFNPVDGHSGNNGNSGNSGNSGSGPRQSGGAVPKEAMRDGSWLWQRNTEDNSEDLIHPNVVVAHTKHGLEILHVYTGRTVTRVSLPEPRFGGGSGLYVDLNGDRVIDHVQAIPGIEQEVQQEDREVGEGEGEREGESDGSDDGDDGDDGDELDVRETIRQMGRNHGRSSHYNVPSCWVQTISGVPPLEQLWEGSLCGEDGSGRQDRGKNNYGTSTMMNVVGGSNNNQQQDEQDNARVVPPIVSSSSASFTSSTSSSRPTAVHPYDVTILTSTGMMTKYNPLGHVLWRSSTDARWHQHPNQHRNTHHDIDAFLPSSALINVDSPGRGRRRRRRGQQSNSGRRQRTSATPTTPTTAPADAQFNDERGKVEHNSHETKSDSRRQHHVNANSNPKSKHVRKVIVGIGNQHMVLVSLETGEQHCRVALEMPSTNKPIVGDYDNDGLNDIVLVTKDSIIGYTMEVTQTRRFLFIMLVFALMMIGFLIFLQLSGLMDDLDEDDYGRDGGRHGYYRGRWREGEPDVYGSGSNKKSKRAMD